MRNFTITCHHPPLPPPPDNSSVFFSKPVLEEYKGMPRVHYNPAGPSRILTDAILLCHEIHFRLIFFSRLPKFYKVIWHYYYYYAKYLHNVRNVL
jgi:hypothetical protein